MEAYGAGLVGSHVAKLPTTRKGRAGCVRRRGLFPLFVCSMFASNGGEALSVSIDDFGAVPGDTSVEVAFANSDAIYQALIRYASSSEDRICKRLHLRRGMLRSTPYLEFPSQCTMHQQASTKQAVTCQPQLNCPKGHLMANNCALGMLT